MGTLRSQSSTKPLLDQTKLLPLYRRSPRCLFLLDYDGTLTPIVANPQAAIPSDELLCTLRTLASSCKNVIWVISGRDQAFLDQFLGHIVQIGLAAEHGAFVRYPGSSEWENLVGKADLNWQHDVVELFQAYTNRMPGAVVERKRAAVTWHFRNTASDQAADEVGKCRMHLEAMIANHGWGLQFMDGKMNLEVRLARLGKGALVTRLVESGHSGPALNLVLCVGDDFTDEDMFVALRESRLPPNQVYSISVGPSSKSTMASWHLPDPGAVVALLSMFGDLVDEDRLGMV